MFKILENAIWMKRIINGNYIYNGMSTTTTKLEEIF